MSGTTAGAVDLSKTGTGVSASTPSKTEAELKEEEVEDSDFERIEEDEDWTIPADWKESPFNKAFVIERFDKRMAEISKNKLNMLYGTSFSMVVGAFLKALFFARKKQNPKQLLSDMVFSVFVSQTVSREWAKVYALFPESTVFKPFEIDSQRTADPDVPKASWVTNSKMNATAVGMLGQLIMECAPGSSSLGQKAKDDGTHFTPKRVEDFPNSEYVKLCNEANKSISSADREALDHFKKNAGHLVEVVATILESDSSSLKTVLDALSRLKMKNF